MDITVTVFDVALFFPLATDILDKYNLDYYCNGSQPFLEACGQKNLDVKTVWQEIMEANPVRNRWKQAWKEWEPGILSDLILRYYSDLHAREAAINEVLAQALKESAGQAEATLQAIRACFNDLCGVLVQHMAREEETLLKRLRTQQGGEINENGLDSKLEEMEKEHEQLGSLIDALRYMTGNYTLTNLSSPLTPLLAIMLQAFDKELTQRLHIENNILFPKIKKMNT